MFISYNLDNSSVIQNKNLPICKSTYFKGNIRKYNSKAYGFFYCKEILKL